MKMYYIKIIMLLVAAFSLPAATIHVDNIKGDDVNDGSAAHPVASLEKGLSLLKRFDRMEVAPNDGKPYCRPYPGPVGKSLVIRHGGTAEHPMVINGNGAVVSGLSKIPADCWKATEDGLYKLPFWPMSNMYRRYKKQDYWLPESRIFFVDGQPARNCLSRQELLETPGGFWWSREGRELFFKLPAGKTIADVSVELPANGGFYIYADYIRVENFNFILSWNDGFDTNGRAHGAIYRNCVGIDNCGQAFSCHNSAIALYEDCVAVRCASSGSCDAHWSNSNYVRCVFMNNVFEAGVAAIDYSAHTYLDCLIVYNKPFEQIWASNFSRMFFDNCVVIGNGGKTPLVALRHGSVSFRQCTLLNAGVLNRNETNNRGTLNIEHSLIGGMKNALMDIPTGMEERTMLSGNIYFGSNGFKVAGKLLPFGTEGGRFDVHSQWYDGPLIGPLNTELPKSCHLRNSRGEVVRVGAKLPESVWRLYEKYLYVETSPAGISWKENTQ